MATGKSPPKMDTEEAIFAFLEYIPDVGSMYQVSKTIIHSLQHNGDASVSPAGLNIIGGAIRDILHFNNLVETGMVVTVHSLYENASQNALGNLLDSLSGHISNREKIESVIRQCLRNVNLNKKAFLLVHHLEENDPFHNRFRDNRVRIAKYGLIKGAVYLGLITYDNYTKKSLIMITVPHSFKEGAPIKISWKFDRLWNGTQHHIVRSVGTIGKCEIEGSNPEQKSFEIEMLRNQCYYWFAGTVYIGDIEKIGEGLAEEYKLNSYMELKMYSTNPNLPLGTISKLELIH